MAGAPDLRAQLLGGWWVLLARRDTREGRELHLTRALSGLSEQASRVLARSALGASGKEIAIELGLGESTVSVHLAAALDHLKLSRSEVGAILGSAGGMDLGAASSSETRWVVRLRIGAALPDVLTSTEREVVTLVLEGLSNREIADARRRSRRTIANQLAASFRKLRVASRGELYARWPPPTELVASGEPG